MRLPIILLACVGVVLGKYESFPGVTNTYNLHTERVDWDTANEVCQLEGGHLIVINSQSEATVAKLLFGRIVPLVQPHFWRYDLLHVGITDKAREGVWRTVLGGLLSDAGYNVWRKGEPNNAVNGEHCGGIERDGRFTDLQCNENGNACPFICEKERTDTAHDAGPDVDSIEFEIDARNLQ